MKTSANSVKTESETTSWMTFSSQIENGPPNCDDPMRLAGTWKQYSNRAMPQLSSTMASMPKRSSLDLNAMWPYQASVMKAFDMMSRATVAIPLNIGRRGLKPRKSINFFRMICTSCKKMPSATFFIGMAIGYRVYGAFGYGLRQVASVCLAIGDAADPPTASCLPPDRCRGRPRNLPVPASTCLGIVAGAEEPRKLRTACPASVPGLFQQSGKVGDVAEIVDDPVRIGLR